MKDFDIPLCFSNKPDGQVPVGVLEFDQVLAESDALVLAIAEAGGHYCASFKNIVDWLITKNRFVFVFRVFMLTSCLLGYYLNLYSTRFLRISI